MIRRAFLLSLSAFVAAGSLCAQDWSQWGANAQHTSSATARGQVAQRILGTVVYDPLVAQQPGQILIHYQAPLADGANLYMAVKSGTFSGYGNWSTVTWNEQLQQWKKGRLVTRWRFASDWKPVPVTGEAGPGWEPVFHAALGGRFLYVPGFGGSLYKVNKATGAVVARIRPFGAAVNPDLYTVGPPAVDRAGNVYYHAIQLDAANPWTQDPVDAWVVKVAANGSTKTVSYSALTPGAPSGGGCLGTFAFAELPWPPSPTAVPPSAPCGRQRPPVNASPAVAADGTIYTVSRAHLHDRTSYLIALRSDLSLKWAASLRDRLTDGCNVVLPRSGTPGGCRAGAPDGVDPSQNRPGAGRLVDDSTASPVVLPDGSILLGTYTRYNWSQGHTMKFSSGGDYLGSYPFGWDLTPAVWKHGSAYSVILKENHYSGLGSYCDDDTKCPADRTASNPGDPEGFFITQLASDLSPEWKFKGTETRSCSRQSDGSVHCVDDHPHGFEWCVNAVAVDGAGTVFANSEDGNLYAIRQGGEMRERRFLQLAIGAAYTPLSLTRDGKILTLNDGILFVVGK